MNANLNRKSDRVAVGIDLGTTFSVVAIYEPESGVRVLKNSFGKSTTPSVVCFLPNGETLFGEDAKAEQAAGASDVASFFKRQMGDASYFFSAGDTDYSATELSTILLKGLKAEAEEALGCAITDAVIAVPAYFNDAQRRATIDAGRAAGFNVLRVLNEPTAAALAFGLKSGSNRKRYLIYDLGGGTFDVSIVEIKDEEIRVLASDGDHKLGGKDWDDRLLAYVSSVFHDETGLDLSDDAEAVGEALVRAERAKIELSSRFKTTVRVSSGGETRTIVISRATFEEITSDLFERTVELCASTLALCQPPLDWGDLDAIILVGGSTRLSVVARSLAEKSGKPILNGVNVDEAVATGAALQAAAELEVDSNEYALETRPKSRGVPCARLFDVTSHSLGMIAENEDRSKYVNSVIIPKNSSVPARRVKRHRLRVGDGKGAELEVYVLQSESEIPDACDVSRKFVFSGFAAESSGVAEIDVAYGYDQNGTIVVEAVQASTGKALTRREEASFGDLSWLKESPRDISGVDGEDLTIVFAIDVSGSMTGEPIKKARAAFLSFVDKFEPTTKIGIVQFADSTAVALNPTCSRSLISRAIQEVDVRWEGGVGLNTTAVPLETACCCAGVLLSEDVSTSRLLRRKRRRFPNGRVFIVVLTDGCWERRKEAIRESRRCAASGVDILAVGFGFADKGFLKEISTIEEGALFTDVGRLEQTFSKIAQTIKTNVERSLPRVRIGSER